MKINISDLDQTLCQLIKDANKMPIAILENKQAVAYVLTADAYEKIMDGLDDVYLNRIAKKRIAGNRIQINLSDL